MRIADTKTPVVVFNCRLAGLAIMRSLGPLGINIYGIDSDKKAPAFLSRYCKKAFPMKSDLSDEKACINFLKGVAREVGGKPVLIATSDETSELVADNREELSRYFIFPQNDGALVRGLASKKEMYFLAKKHGVPVPHTDFPNDMEDVLRYAEEGVFPVVLKGIYGNLLMDDTGLKMCIVRDRDELITSYKRMVSPGTPNMMLQEYIPGGDDEVYIFNGYFDSDSKCLAAFTGHKLRQFPIHTGCASMGVCAWDSIVSERTTRFIKEIGYRGILDIGYKYDRRDGLYKALDINPRIGQAFRIFLGKHATDVARVLYLDLTGQEVPADTPREGRRWLIEDYDLIATLHYYKEGSLRPGQWLKSLHGIEETAWFCARDPLPFLSMVRALINSGCVWICKEMFSKCRQGLSRVYSGP